METTFTATNDNILVYESPLLLIQILGGIKISQLDTLRVTLKVNHPKREYRLPRFSLNLYNSGQSQKVCQQIADRLEYTLEEVEEQFYDMTSKLENYRLEKLNYLSGEGTQEKELTDKEKKSAENYLQDKSLMENLLNDINKLGIVGEDKNKLILYLAYTSRLMETPLHIVCKGSSSSGKTSLITGIAKTLPENHRIELTSMSKNALFFSDREQLHQKLLLIEDLDSCDFQALLNLRELISRKRLSKSVAMVNRQTGKLETKTISIEASVATVSATTKEIYTDNGNRSLVINVDDGLKQTLQINRYQQLLYAGKINAAEQDNVIEKLQNIQLVLKPLKVINPYATELQLPERIDSPRRAMAIYLQFISAVAFLHQQQRKITVIGGESCVVVDKKDIEIANDLLRDVILSRTDSISQPTRTFFEELKSYLKKEKKENFNTKEIKEVMNLKPTSVKTYLAELLEHFYIKIESGNKHRGYTYQLLSKDEYQSLQTQVDKALNKSLGKAMK